MGDSLHQPGPVRSPYHPHAAAAHYPGYPPHHAAAAAAAAAGHPPPPPHSMAQMHMPRPLPVRSNGELMFLCHAVSVFCIT